jgi:hypothetical protein
MSTPNKLQLQKGPGGQKVSLAEKTVNAISAPTSMAIGQTNERRLICLSTAIAEPHKCNAPLSDHFFRLRSVQRADVFLFFGCFSVGSIDRAQMTKAGTGPCWLDIGKQSGCIHGRA